MRFLLIIGHDENFGPSQDLIEAIRGWNAAQRKAGILEDSNPLEPWQNARHVRTRGGKIVVQEGSFSTSREKVSAYALINCGSMEEAVEIASSHPMARVAVIEIRPVWTDLAGD